MPLHKLKRVFTGFPDIVSSVTQTGFDSTMSGADPITGVIGFGPHSEYRYIVACYGASDDTAYNATTSATIGGVSATRVGTGDQDDGSTTGCAMWYALLSTAVWPFTAGQVRFFTDGNDNASAIVYSIVATGALTVLESDQDTATPNVTNNLSPTGSTQAIIQTGQNVSASEPTLGGVTLDRTVEIDTGDWQCVGSLLTTSSQSNRNLQITNSGSGTAISGLFGGA